MNITTRSRTGLFLSYRNSRARPTRSFSRGYDEDYDEQRGLISATSIDIELPPKWVDIAEQVELILADTQAKIAALEKLHAKHVLPGFTDRSLEEQEIEAATTDITKQFRRCQSLLQHIVPDHSFPPSQNPHHQAQAAKNVQRGLAAKVQDLSATFRKKQRVYMEKLQGHAIKNQDLLIASGAISLKGPESMNALEDDVEAATHTRSQSLVLHDTAPTDLQSRNRELTEIAKSIASLAELFKDLSVLVIDQGTILDSVEYNIETTAVHVGEAVKDLDVATRYQKNTGRRKCILLLLIIIFGLIVVIILKPKRHAAPSPPIQSSGSLRRSPWLNYSAPRTSRSII